MANEEDLDNLASDQVENLHHIVEETLSPEAGTKAAEEVEHGADPNDVEQSVQSAIEKAKADPAIRTDEERAMQESLVWGSGKSEVE